MDKQVLMEHYEAWCSRFRKRLNKVEFRSYLKALDGIPEHHLPDITGIILELERFPSPTAIKNIWRQWMKSDGLLETRYDQECPTCRGDGCFIAYRTPQDGQTWRDSYRNPVHLACRCRYETGFTLKRAEERGYVPDPLTFTEIVPPQGLADLIVEDMEKGLESIREYLQMSEDAVKHVKKRIRELQLASVPF